MYYPCSPSDFCKSSPAGAAFVASAAPVVEGAVTGAVAVWGYPGIPYGYE